MSQPQPSRRAPTAVPAAPPKPAAKPTAAASIRRFDVFAEYNRLRNEAHGIPPEQAKGEALWVAKVVAARKFTLSPRRKAEYAADLSRHAVAKGKGAIHTFDGEPQTAELFDQEIVARMGPKFYEDVFSPAIARAYQAGEQYEDIRDRLRAPWNLQRKGL